MRILRWIVGLAILAGVGLVGWSYQWGGLRMKRDNTAFAEKLAACEPFEQDAYVPRMGTFHWSILGPEGETCKLRIPTLGPDFMTCAAPVTDLPAITEAFVAQQENIGFFGITGMQFSTENMDAYTALLNSEACALE